MKKTGPIFIRLLLLGGLAAGGYYFYQHRSLPIPIPEKLSQILGANNLSIKDLPIPQNVIDKTTQKLTQSQPIIENPPSVQGVSTDVSAQAQELVSTSINQISQQIQNLPKQEAANVLRQACDQVAKELEK